MIDLKPRHLAEVTRILKEHVPNAEIRVFGSRVDSTARAHSDLDLAVVGKSALEARALRLLKEAFEESDLPFRVDVLDWHRLSPDFQRVIAARYELLAG